MLHSPWPGLRAYLPRGIDSLRCNLELPIRSSMTGITSDNDSDVDKNTSGFAFDSRYVSFTDLRISAE